MPQAFAGYDWTNSKAWWFTIRELSQMNGNKLLLWPAASPKTAWILPHLLHMNENEAKHE
jgi:hypothetical protein